MRLRSLVVVSLLASLSFAQSVTSLRGHVTASSHAVVPGARVTLTSLTTGSSREQATDNSGAYEFPQLQPGQYSVQVTASGFQTATQSGLQLLVGTPATIDFTL